MSYSSFLFSLLISKLVSYLISLLRFGQASNFPGKTALTICKNLIQKFKLSENCKIIFITGTNGKSTTCGLITSTLSNLTDSKVISNKSGANLLSGIATTLCHYSNLIGRIICDYLVLEVDEATLPLLTKVLQPDIITITNVFRDQLDRFGELDKTLSLIESGINDNPCTVVLNADDARIAHIKIKNKKIFYGLDLTNKSLTSSINNKSWFTEPEEISNCPNCSSLLSFSTKYMAHLGEYLCTECGLKRPELNFSISQYKTDNLTTNFDLKESLNEKSAKSNFFMSLIGLYNLYNVVCATSTIKTISSKITNVQIQKGFQTYATIFGRGEKIKINNKVVWIYLIKNPTGTTEVLKTLSQINGCRFLIALNDNLADGRDVSWIWDAQFETLSNHTNEIFVSGKRGYDLALRLKYANIPQDKIKVFNNLSKAIQEAAKSTGYNEVLYILPTYTALLELQRMGLAKEAKFE